jgi:hypothetical protein
MWQTAGVGARAVTEFVLLARACIGRRRPSPNLIIGKMAYNEFSYDVEKAWCNADVQSVIADARKADKAITRQTDPIYGGFEKLARSYLAREGETCKDLDNQ